MNLILAGFGKILVQLSATFLVLGTAYLLLFAPNADGPLPLSPEQIAENLAPIGRVQIAEPAAPISTPTQTPVSIPATAAPPAATPAPVATMVATTPETPAVIDESGPVISEAPVAVATEAQIPAADPAPIPAPIPTQGPDPASLQTPSAVPAPTPTASRPSQVAVGAAEASIQLAPDGNGMHGSYRLTPEGIVLYPASMIGPNTEQFTTGPIKGSFWATPSGVAHFRLQPTAPVD